MSAAAKITWPLTPIAHRGLHDAASGIIENTPSAVAAAVAAGYAIEVDLQATADGDAVVFHDETLERLIEGTGDVIRHSTATLRTLRYRQCADRIATLSELLEQVAGRVPLYIEVKTLFTAPGAYEAGIARALAHYRGPVAVMSFDPGSLAALQAAAPQVPRGLISYRWDDDWMPQLPPVQRARLARMDSLAALDVAFVAYDIEALPALEPLAFRASGRPLLTWTVRTPEHLARARAHCDGIIFESFTPDPALLLSAP